MNNCYNAIPICLHCLQDTLVQPKHICIVHGCQPTLRNHLISGKNRDQTKLNAKLRFIFFFTCVRFKPVKMVNAFDVCLQIGKYLVGNKTGPKLNLLIVLHVHFITFITHKCDMSLRNSNACLYCVYSAECESAGQRPDTTLMFASSLIIAKIKSLIYSHCQRNTS